MFDLFAGFCIGVGVSILSFRAVSRGFRLSCGQRPAFACAFQGQGA